MNLFSSSVAGWSVEGVDWGVSRVFICFKANDRPSGLFKYAILPIWSFCCGSPS